MLFVFYKVFTLHMHIVDKACNHATMTLHSDIFKLPETALRIARTPDAVPALRAVWPSRSLVGNLWYLYQRLHSKAGRVRRLSSSSTVVFLERRLLVSEIVAHRLVFGEKESTGTLAPALGYMESLVASLIEPSVELPRLDTLPGIVIAGRGTSIVVPRNMSGTSCFCDVVLVAMFLATDQYDTIFAPGASFANLWQDAMPLRAAQVMADWVPNLAILLPEESPCFTEQFEIDEENAEENTRRAVKRLVRQLENIVRLMRVPAPLTDYDKKARDLGLNVTQFRLTLFNDCLRHGARDREALVEDDAAEMYRIILQLGGWSPIFMPIVRQARVDHFKKYQTDVFLLDGVSPLVRVNILPPGPQRLDFVAEFTDGESLQQLINLNFLGEVHDVENVTLPRSATLLRENPFAQHIKQVDPDMYGHELRSLQSVGFTVHTTTKLRLAYVPKVFVFSLARGVPSRLSRESHRVFTQVSLAPGQTLDIPVLESEALVKYRIIAMACHILFGSTSGHYVLYFRRGGINPWFFYNDLGAQIERVDLDDPSGMLPMGNPSMTNKEFVERNAYLFWATRMT